MSILRAGNTINGKCCKAFATIDGKVEELFYIKSFNAEITKNKTEVPVMGDVWIQNKAGSLSGSGAITMKYLSPVFRKMMDRYATTMIDEYFDFTIVNDDPGSKAGIEEDVNFTFSGVANISNFNDPASY